METYKIKGKEEASVGVPYDWIKCDPEATLEVGSYIWAQDIDGTVFLGRVVEHPYIEGISRRYVADLGSGFKVPLSLIEYYIPIEIPVPYSKVEE